MWSWGHKICFFVSSEARSQLITHKLRKSQKIWLPSPHCNKFPSLKSHVIHERSLPFLLTTKMTWNFLRFSFFLLISSRKKFNIIYVVINSFLLTIQKIAKFLVMLFMKAVKRWNSQFFIQTEQEKNPFFCFGAIINREGRLCERGKLEYMRL